MRKIVAKLRNYWTLIKSLQTGLLTITGVAGYMSARCPVMHWTTLTGLILSLVLSICGSTVLNMWYDRDLDRVMNRTHHRPIARGLISPREAFIVGTVLSLSGVAIALIMSTLFALVVFAGWFFDVVVYTIVLKRKTCWSIVWGGIAGGMPIMAGRALGMGHIDIIGILLSLSVLFWIPTHMLTFSIKYREDYAAAGIPTFPATYGDRASHLTIAASSIIAAALIGIAAALIGVHQGFLHLMGILSGILMILCILVIIKPSRKLHFGLFKYASVYMLAMMLALAL